MEGNLPGGIWKSIRRLAPRFNPPAAPLVLLGVALAAGAPGCAAPALAIIPSAIGALFDVATLKSNSDKEAAVENQDANPGAADASESPQKLTPENICHLMAIARPDLMVVELRKGAAGAPEYRELHLASTKDAARWVPIVDGETGPDGWRPAVNFMAMDFNPPLTDAIPGTGTSYLAYAPTTIDSSDPTRAAALKARLGRAAGEFSWNGQIYEYAVARKLVCLSPPTEQSAAISDSTRPGPIGRK